MTKIIDLLNMMPKAIRLTLIGMLFGGLAFAGHEVRYMTVAQYTKSYILDLKAEIRETRRDLRSQDLPARVREILTENLAALIDELCYELPNDRECKNQDPES